MTDNEKLMDESIAHAIEMQGYSKVTERRIVKLLNSFDSELIREIEKAIDSLPQSSFNTKRLDATLRKVYDVNNRAYDAVLYEFENEMKELSDYEAALQVKIIGAVTAATVYAVSSSKVYTEAYASPFRGRTLFEWVAGLNNNRAIAIRDAVRIGYVEGKTSDQIIGSIKGKKALQYKDGVLNSSRRDAESITRTAITHFSNYAGQAVAENNSKVISGYIYTAVLDNRTTELCAGRNGNFYKVGEPRPEIPAHINCRSSYVIQLRG